MSRLLFRASRLFIVGGAAAGLLAASSSSRAAVFAQYVPGSYMPGTLSGFDTTFETPTVVNSAPGGLTGVNTAYQGVVSVFNPPYDNDQILEIGPGGQVALQFANPVKVSNAPTVGVFSNAGLTDAAFFTSLPDGYYPDQLPPGTDPTFGGGMINVAISSDDKIWHSLGSVNVNIPENVYKNAGPFDFAAPTNPMTADFGVPFTGTLDSFDDQSYSQIVSTLGNSAGGTWLNFASTGLSQFSYIQFSEPTTGSNFALQAVSLSNSAVPEPASGLGIILLGGLLLRRRVRAA